MRNLWLPAVILTIAGCSNSETMSEFEGGEFIPASVAPKTVDDDQPLPSAEGSSVEPKQYRHVIYDAEIRLEVQSFSEFRTNLPNMVAEMGGYISSVQFNQTQSRGSKTANRSGTWKLKIKSTEFERFIAELANVGTILGHHQTAQDMTSEFVDLDARITNKKRMEARVLELINQSKRSLSEVVSLEKELARIRGEVERMQGRLNYIRNRTEFSTLTIVASEHASNPVVAVLPFSQRVSDAWNQSTSLLQSIISQFAIAATYILPWLAALLAISLPVFLLYRWLRLRWLKMEALRRA